MYRILMPISSNEERALEAAETVASLPGAPDDLEVTILHVYREFEVADEGGIVESETIYEEMDQPKSIAAVADYFENREIAYTVREDHADPAAKIVELASEIDADQIVMCGRKQSPVGKVLFGSTTQSVLLHAPVPVTVVVN